MIAPSECRPGVGSRLDELLTSRFLPKRWARRIWSADELPLRLQRRVECMTADSEWRAYSDDEQIFFALARLHKPAAAHDSLVALDVYFLDSDAAVYSAAVWVHDAERGWWLDSVLEASYDCEHGWWHDALDRQPPIAPSVGALLPDVRQARRLSAAPTRARKLQS